MPDFGALYLSLIFLLAISSITLSIMLISIRIPNKENMKQYNIARYVLALAYFILGILGCYKNIASYIHATIDLNLMHTLTLVSASYQALLFTFSLITLIQPAYVSIRRVVLQFGIISFVFVILLFLLYNAPHSLYNYLYNIVSVIYIFQLRYYIIIFRKKYAQYIKQFENFYNEDENNRLRWVKTSFYMALSIGILALFISYFPLQHRILFLLIIIAFYIYFAIKYSNYPLDFQYIIPAVSTEHISSSVETECDNMEAVNNLPLSEKEQRLQQTINKWVREKQFLHADMSRDDIAKSLGTDRDFLTLFFQCRMKTEFRIWRSQLRIEEAKKLLLQYPDMSISKIGHSVGIADRSNFQKKFVDLVGMSPKEWRKQNLKS